MAQLTMKKCWSCNSDVVITTAVCPFCKVGLGLMGKDGVAAQAVIPKKTNFLGQPVNCGHMILIAIGIYLNIQLLTCITNTDKPEGMRVGQPGVVSVDSPAQAVRGITRVKSATRVGADLQVTIGQSFAVNEQNYMLMMAITQEQVCKELVKTKMIDLLQTVTFTITAPVEGKNGAPEEPAILRMTFQAATLSRLDWDLMDQYSLLEYANLEWLNLTGAMTVKAFARETPRLAGSAPTFYNKAMYNR